MAKYIKQANIFGRLGTGIGKGLASTLPEEINRGRMASGLQQLGEQKGLSPFQQFAGLASIPGVAEKPQLLQSGGDLLRQQAYLEALKNQYEAQNRPQGQNANYIPTPEDLNRPIKGEISTLATPESTAESYKNYIPPPEQLERKEAYENFNANPARYNYNYENALNERKAITSRNQEIQKSLQAQETKAVEKEEKIKEALQNETKKLGLNNVHPKAYQKFEEKVLNAVLSQNEGGEGLTQEQAIKTYSKELDQANRNYLDLSSLEAWSPREFNRSVDALQKQFAARDELPMMMDQLIADYGVSPSYAAHKTYPIKPNEMKTLHAIPKHIPGITGIVAPKINNTTYAKLKKEMGKTGSPLSIAYELQRKNLDPREWIKYLDNHRDNLEVWQADQLSKNINLIDLKDMWLQAWE